VNWGEWALVYGKLSAVKEGAADRIKRESTIAMLADPKMEAASRPRPRRPPQPDAARAVHHRLGVEQGSGEVP